MILAGIDVGTNTIRLLVVEINNTNYRELYSARTITRLGQDLDRTGLLSPEARERSIAALDEFSGVLRRYPSVHTAVVGTSALRNAANAGEFISAVRKATGLDIHVVDGGEEARLTLLGVARALVKHQSERKAHPLDRALVMDIGGGSTELIITRKGNIQSTASLPLGSVYLTERFLKSDPPAEEDLNGLRLTVRAELRSWENIMNAAANKALRGVELCAGTAGTITTLAAMDQKLQEYDPDRINGFLLSKASLDGMVKELSTRALRDRRTMPGLEPGREDIILAGAVITQEVMEHHHFSTMLVSDWGLREGIVFDLHDKLAVGTRSVIL